MIIVRKYPEGSIFGIKIPVAVLSPVLILFIEKSFIHNMDPCVQDHVAVVDVIDAARKRKR